MAFASSGGWWNNPIKKGPTKRKLPVYNYRTNMKNPEQKVSLELPVEALFVILPRLKETMRHDQYKDHVRLVVNALTTEQQIELFMKNVRLMKMVEHVHEDVQVAMVGKRKRAIHSINNPCEKALALYNLRWKM